MPDHLIRARQPEPSASPRLGRDPDVLASFLADAAHFPGGLAAGIATPASEAEVAALVRAASSVLPIGAQSSLTRAATPRGGGLLGTRDLHAILGLVDA